MQQPLFVTLNYAFEKVQDFLRFYGLPPCYIIYVSGEVGDTEPRDKDIGMCEGRA